MCRGAVLIMVGMASTAAGSGVLLERAAALTELGELLRAVGADRRGRLVLVRGEAGVGKTEIARRFCDGEQAARVLWGACDPLFTPQVFRVGRVTARVLVVGEAPSVGAAGGVGVELHATIAGRPEL